MDEQQDCGRKPDKTVSAAGCHIGLRKYLAHAYVPWQSYDKAYSPCEALQKGTLFPNLWGVYRIPK